MKKNIPAVIILLALLLPAAVSALTGEEVLEKADQVQTFTTSVSSGEMRIKDRFDIKVTSFNAWSRGADESLIEFTSTAERGQKVLRTADELYLFYPDAEELIRMQGSALRQSMLGSDISYEDMTGNKDRTSKYTVELQGEEKVQGKPCYIIFMTAKTRTVPYPKQKVWIDKESFIVRKGEYYTKSGRLLKEMEILETKVIKGREIAVQTRIADKMKKDTETIMILSELQLDVPVDPKIFSLEELSW